MTRPACGFKPLKTGVRDKATKFTTYRYARWDGEPKRAPKKGELFISGAIPICFLAKQDMTTEYYIAVLI